MENLEKYQPTKEELQLINDKFAKEPYASLEELYVFWSLAADDDIVPNRFMKFDVSAFKKFKLDIEEDNVPFMVAHKTGGFGEASLPLAQVFKGRIEKDGEVTSLYTKKFMQKDLDISGVNTDDFMRAYFGGTIQDVSVGWRTNFYECSICGNDIRSLDCEHMPGQEYKDDETGEKKMCIVLVFHNKARKRNVQLIEESAVYKGAIRRAKLKGAGETPKKFVFVHDASEIKKLSSGVVVEMALGMPILEDFERGKGRGKGGPRQGDGGASRCRCPRCSHTQEHERGKPCTEIRCEKCGAKMVGANSAANQGGSVMEIDLKKLFAGEYSEKELADIKLTDSQVDEVLAVEEMPTAEGDEGLKEKFGDKLNELLVKFPASELNLEESERWTRTFINDLPDSSFAVIEPAYTKSETDNKNARHLPCSSDEKDNIPHLKNALAMAGQIEPVTDSITESELRSKAESYLKKHKSALGSEKEQLKALAKEKEGLESKITGLNGKVTDLEAEKTKQGNTIESLNETIVGLKKEKDTFCKDVRDEILDISVQVKGNDFDKEAKEKELAGLGAEKADVTLDKLLNERNELRKELDKLYLAGTHTKGAGSSSKEESADVPDSAFKSGKGF